nr:flavonol synthase/flavanone 3-hydroxylase [Quercus suber]
MGAERVQDIAKSSKETIPDAFIRLETEQPGITTVHGAVLEVPTIDFSDPDEEKVLSAIEDAARNWGMFQIVNHEIPSEAIAKLQAAGKGFFELSREEKEVYAKPSGSKSMEGYGTALQKEVEGKKAWVDHLFHKIWPPSAINYRFWPENPSFYREANEEYAKHLHGVVDKLFKSLSLGLGLERHELKEAAGGDNLEYLLKINYYPPCLRPDLALGVVAHTDMCTITILVPNDVQGLQASRDGRWYDVKYIPNALVIHIGDQIEVLCGCDGREANEEYAKHLHGVVDKLFKSLSLGLGLERHELKEAAGGDNLEYLLKINYYPPCLRPDLALGVVAHTDMCTITILVPNDVQGLQASRDGRWYDVKYIPNALVIHIGDQIEILSNGKYKSVLHRTTVNKEKARMSWPVFMEPPSDFEIGPHPKLVNKENPPKFKTKKYSDYVYCKLNKIPQ